MFRTDSGLLCCQCVANVLRMCCQVLDGSFVLIWAMTVTHAATDLKVAPHKRTGDVSIDVCVANVFLMC